MIKKYHSESSFFYCVVSVCVLACVHVCVCLCVCGCVKCGFMWICVSGSVFMWVYMCAYECLSMYVCVCVYVQYMCVYVSLSMPVHVYLCECIFVHRWNAKHPNAKTSQSFPKPIREKDYRVCRRNYSGLISKIPNNKWQSLSHNHSTWSIEKFEVIRWELSLNGRGTATHSSIHSPPNLQQTLSVPHRPHQPP